MTNKHTFLNIENEKRSEQVKKSATHEEILEQLNQNVLLKKNDTHSHYGHLPNLFIFGLPRSGTTLLSQLIANCLDVGYVDNIVARFWLSPDRVICFSYQDGCNAPEQVLIDKHKKVVNKFGYNISISCSAPKYFGVSKKRPKDELGKRIFTSLKEKGFE